MEITVKNKTKTELEIEINGETETLLNPITHILNDNPDVEYAASMADHPLATRRTLYIRMSKGDPHDALKKAVALLQAELKDFNKNFK